MGGQRLPAFDRFCAKVRRDTFSCWVWTGYIHPKLGYGFFNPHGTPVTAHRFAFEAFRFKIPPKMTIDHVCRNRRCVNPFHLQVVTLRENILRGISPAAKHAKATHCSNGHAFDKANTYVTPAGARQCRTCRRNRQIIAGDTNQGTCSTKPASRPLPSNKRRSPARSSQ